MNAPYFVGDHQFFRDNEGQLWKRTIKVNHNWIYRSEWKQVKG